MNDTDFDCLANDFETTISNTDPDNALSASKFVVPLIGITDDEIYAGGPVEENGIKSADTSNDWANPGTNHKQ